jgi:hypothetical protein
MYVSNEHAGETEMSNPTTRKFNDEAAADTDAASRKVSVWKHHSFGAWAKSCNLTEFVTGTYDGLIRDLGYGTSGSYVWHARHSN